MAKEPIAYISHGNIGRTHVARQHPVTGLPMEASVPTLGALVMYDRHGTRLNTPTRCHRADVPALRQRYQPQQLADRLAEGYLQEGVCPHMPREQLAGRASVPAPAGYSLCDGRGELDPSMLIGGCEHLKKAVLARRALAAQEASERKNTVGKAALLLLGQQMASTATGLAADAAQRAKEPAAPEPKVRKASLPAAAGGAG